MMTQSNNQAVLKAAEFAMVGVVGGGLGKMLNCEC